MENQRKFEKYLQNTRKTKQAAYYQFLILLIEKLQNFLENQVWFKFISEDSFFKKKS